MKLLFLANRIPYPPYRGDKLKIFNLARRLARKHELHLLTFIQDTEEAAYQKELGKYFQEVHLVHLPRYQSLWSCAQGLFSSVPLQVCYFHSSKMKQAVQELLARNVYDAVHIQHLRMSPYLAEAKEVPRILDLPDAFSLYWKRRKERCQNPLIRPFLGIEQRRLETFEKIMHRFDRTLVCSEEDRAYLAGKQGGQNLYLLPNGVDLDTFTAGGHDYGHHQTLLFTGNMDYAPNVDAVVYFARELFPEIEKRVPGVRFIIAGQRPVPKVQALAGQSIQVTGFVKDLVSVYNQASVVVAPLRFGAGTQNKVLEAMALGIPVVCTDIGFKGLGIESGEGALQAMGKLPFINAVCGLLEKQELREEVGKKGIRVIRERFGWDVIAGQLEAHFLQIAGKQ